MRYKLADGSFSTDYEIGDEFVVVNDHGKPFTNGSIVSFYADDCSMAPMFKLIKGKCMYNHADGEPGAYEGWKLLAPTHETKRKAQARKRKFTIDRGDYIDSREFSREECEKFCNLAVECGFRRGEWMMHGFSGPMSLRFLGVINGVFWSDNHRKYTNNITAQFREFLDKEKGVKKFTKADLKDGMRVVYRNGKERVMFFGYAWEVTEEPVPNEIAGKMVKRGGPYCANDDLTSKFSRQDDVMKVTNRDGTVLFEREEEKVTIELTKEQVERVKRQFGIK